MPKLSSSQGFRLHGTTRVELHSVRVLIVALVQALDALVRGHVDLVQALVALFQALIALFQAHPPQGGLVWMIKKQVVVQGLGSGLVGAV